MTRFELDSAAAQVVRDALHGFTLWERGELALEDLRERQLAAFLAVEAANAHALAYTPDEALMTAAEQGLVDCGRRWDDRSCTVTPLLDIGRNPNAHVWLEQPEDAAEAIRARKIVAVPDERVAVATLRRLGVPNEMIEERLYFARTGRVGRAI